MNTINRRSFIKKASHGVLGAICLPRFIPSAALGANGKTLPSNMVVMGCIGVGWQGGSNMGSFLRDSEVRVVAVCDIDQKHLNWASNRVNKTYGGKDCRAYHDYREVIARKDIDAVSIGLPDHWHAIPAVAAAKAGMDIYGEKPLAHNWAEGRAICDAVQKYERIWQTGSWQRSLHNFRFGCELVLNGRVGRIKRVEVGLPSGHSDFGKTKGQETPGPAPSHLDYNTWLGPAPYASYCPARVHKNWRWHLDYGGGQLMDWVGHHVDIAHWGLGFDYDGPVEVEGYGEYPKEGKLWNTATKYRITTKYANGLPMIIAGGHKDIRSGTKWIGENGWVWVTRGKIDAHPRSLLKENINSNEINLYRSPGHHREFIQSVKSRKPTLAPCEVAHRSATPGLLGQIAMLLGRKIKWDPKKERIIDDPQAERMLSRPMRSPWHL